MATHQAAICAREQDPEPDADAFDVSLGGLLVDAGSRYDLERGPSDVFVRGTGIFVTKGSAPSAITCTISAAQDGFTLSGVVSGTIVHTG